MYVAHHRKANALSTVLGCVEGGEEVLLHLLGNALAVVGDGELRRIKLCLDADFPSYQ